jgi:hypothetical protein
VEQRSHALAAHEGERGVDRVRVRDHDVRVTGERRPVRLAREGDGIAVVTLVVAAHDPDRLASGVHMQIDGRSETDQPGDLVEVPAKLVLRSGRSPHRHVAVVEADDRPRREHAKGELRASAEAGRNLWIDTADADHEITRHDLGVHEHLGAEGRAPDSYRLCRGVVNE